MIVGIAWLRAECRVLNCGQLAWKRCLYELQLIILRQKLLYIKDAIKILILSGEVHVERIVIYGRDLDSSDWEYCLIKGHSAEPA